MPRGKPANPRPKPQPIRRKGTRRERGEAIPWDDIEARYVQGDESHRTLAAVYALDERAVFQHSSAGHWAVKRLEWRSRLQKEIAERLFAAKVEMAMQVRLDGIADRIAHLETLAEVRRVGLTSKLMKIRTEDGEEVWEFESSWTSADHVNYRKAYDEAESGILRAMGIKDADMETVKQILFAYLPENAKSSTDGTSD